MPRYLPWLAACTVLTVLTLRQRFAVVTVTGDSMKPAFAPGDRVLVRRARIGQLRPGQVVVAEMPGAGGAWTTRPGGPVGQREWIIKRVTALPGDPRPDDCLPEMPDLPGRLVPPGKLVVLGDNPIWSYDSRQLGYIPGERLLGIVVRRFAPEPDGPRPPLRSPRGTVRKSQRL